MNTKISFHVQAALEAGAVVVKEAGESEDVYYLVIEGWLARVTPDQLLKDTKNTSANIIERDQIVRWLFTNHVPYSFPLTYVKG